jgi:hypothetical protein
MTVLVKHSQLLYEDIGNVRILLGAACAIVTVYGPGDEAACVRMITNVCLG